VRVDISLHDQIIDWTFPYMYFFMEDRTGCWWTSGGTIVKYTDAVVIK